MGSGERMGRRAVRDIDGKTERSRCVGAHESIGKGASFKSVVLICSPLGDF